MELEDNSLPARNIKNGRDTVVIPAGQRLIIETSPGGSEILDEVVPVGKQWEVIFNIDIIETSV